jgi:hypothetical protein
MSGFTATAQVAMDLIKGLRALAEWSGLDGHMSPLEYVQAYQATACRVIREHALMVIAKPCVTKTALLEWLRAPSGDLQVCALSGEIEAGVLLILLVVGGFRCGLWDVIENGRVSVE